MSKQLNAFMVIAIVALLLIAGVELILTIRAFTISAPGAELADVLGDGMDEEMGDLFRDELLEAEKLADEMMADMRLVLAWAHFMTAVGMIGFAVLIAIAGQVLENVAGARNDAAIQALRQANETPHTGRYRVIGMDGDSGMSTSVVVDASNPSDAKRVARGQGVTGIESVQPA